MRWKYPFAKVGNFVSCSAAKQTPFFLSFLLWFHNFQAWTFSSKYPSESSYFFQLPTHKLWIGSIRSLKWAQCFKIQPCRVKSDSFASFGFDKTSLFFLQKESKWCKMDISGINWQRQKYKNITHNQKSFWIKLWHHGSGRKKIINLMSVCRSDYRRAAHFISYRVQRRVERLSISRQWKNMWWVLHNLFYVIWTVFR